MSKSAIFQNVVTPPTEGAGGLVVDPTLLLVNIKKAATEAISMASSEELECEACWEELQCRQVELAPAESDEMAFRCVIGSADPDCTELQDYVASYIYCKMGVSVEICTAW